MLPRSQRLSVEQFNVVIKKGRVSHSPLFLVRALESNMIKHARIAAIAPQKIAKSAVLRNKLRRRVYEAVAPFYSQIKDNLHIIVSIKQAVLSAEFSQLSSDLKNHFVKAGLFK